MTLPASYLGAGHLTHAYAITGHKAQGMTTACCFALGDDSLHKEWGYTAMSRGRKENRLYLMGGHDLGREEVGGAVTYEGGWNGAGNPFANLVARVSSWRSRGRRYPGLRTLNAGSVEQMQIADTSATRKDSTGGGPLTEL